jgi:hypothetical protein
MPEVVPEPPRQFGCLYAVLILIAVVIYLVAILHVGISIWGCAFPKYSIYCAIG